MKPAALSTRPRRRPRAGTRGYIERIRQGRRNHYEIHDHVQLRHPVERHERVASLIALVHGKQKRDRGRPRS